MGNLIAAIGVIISALTGLISYTSAAEAKKKKIISKTLVSLSLLLNKIINNGLIIIGEFGKDQFDKKVLIRLIEEQSIELNKLAKTISDNFYWSGLLWNIPNFSDSYFLINEHPSIYRILEIYNPAFPSRLCFFIDYKSETLTFLSYFLLKEIDKRNFYIREISYIDEELIFHNFHNPYINIEDRWRETYFEQILTEWEKNGLIKFKLINIKENKEKKEYVELSIKRLNKLSDLLEQLNNLIREYYKPHELI